MEEQVSHVVRKSDLTMTLMMGRKPDKAPTLSGVKMKVPGSRGANILICDIWKKGNRIEAYPVATMMIGEVVGIDIEASHAGEIMHDRIRFPKITVNGCFEQYLMRKRSKTLK